MNIGFTTENRESESVGESQMRLSPRNKGL